jgi:hypothetical protein
LGPAFQHGVVEERKIVFANDFLDRPVLHFPWNLSRRPVAKFFT